jgi:hypothetical protein
MLKQRAVKAVDAPTFTKQADKVKKNVCQKAYGNCLLGQERSSDGGIHATGDHSNVRNILRNTKNDLGSFRTKGG